VAELQELRSNWQAIAPPAFEAGQTRRMLRIVAFDSEAEYQPFRINAFSPAYFVSGSGQDTIVLGRLTKESFPALRHEFVHHLVRARWQRLPLWLEEGLADLHGGIEAGVAQARGGRLRRTGLLPLRELALVDRASSGYQEKEAALQFYAQSWALTGLLMTEPAYRGGAWSLVDRLIQGESLEAAVAGVYGQGLEQMESDLAGHLKRLKATGKGATPALQPATASTAKLDEVGLALAGLLLLKGDTGGAQRYLDRLAETSRGNPELWSLTGDLALKEGRAADARIALQEALRLGSRNPRGLRQLAVLEQNALNRDGLEPVLARLVAVNPADDEARQALATLQSPR
jgi:tetratricopeptide (TPR) repeat protein